MWFFHHLQPIEGDADRSSYILVLGFWYDLLRHVLAFPLGVVPGQGVGTAATVSTPAFRLPSILFLEIIQLCHTFERRQVLAHALTVMVEIREEIGQDRLDSSSGLP